MAANVLPGNRANLAWLLVISMVFGPAGCVKSERIHFHGAVTFCRAPVPAGLVVFTPDLSKGHHGPQGSAAIENGLFDSRRHGKGTSAGPVVVTVYGYDGRTAGTGDDAFSPGQPLFPPYTTRVELSKTSNAFTFDIPANNTP